MLSKVPSRRNLLLSVNTNNKLLPKLNKDINEVNTPNVKD